MVEDMITLLEGTVQPELRKGRYPDRKVARRVSEVVRACRPRTRRLSHARRSGRACWWHGICRRRWRIQPRHQLHQHPHHGRRARRLSRRTGPLPAGRRARLPVGQPHDHRATPARPGRRALHWLLRAHPRRAQLDVRPGSRPRSTRCWKSTSSATLQQARPRLPEGHHGARDRRRADG
jgi:hypothetical protein